MLKEKEIQSLEYQLRNTPNCGSSSQLFTAMMHKTSEWIDKESNNKAIHVSPYKTELDKQVEQIAYYIECGEITENAILLTGTCRNTILPKLTDTHKRILQAARKQRIINKLKNNGKNRNRSND